MDVCPPLKPVGVEVEAPVDVEAVRSETVHLLRRIPALQQPIPRSAARVAANRNDITDEHGPLALNTDESPIEIEHEVVAMPVGQWLEYSYAQLDRGMDDGRLGDRALLVGRQLYVLRIENGSDGSSSNRATAGRRAGVCLKQTPRASDYAVAAASSFGTSFQRSSRR